MKSRLFVSVIGLAALGTVLSVASSAWAIDKCKVRIDKKTGVLRVDAAGVAGPLTWGASLGSETRSFANAATCIVGANAKKCELADPASLAAKTPPAGCTIYLSDGATPCSTWIRGCSPAPRETAGLIWKDANGLTFGSSDGTAGVALHSSGGAFFRVNMAADGSGILPSGQAVFASSDCSGPPLIYGDDSLIRQVHYFGPGVPAYYASGAGTSLTYGSYRTTSSELVDQAACDNINGPGTTHMPPLSCCIPGSYGPLMAASAATIDLSGFTAPFHFEAP